MPVLEVSCNSEGAKTMAQCRYLRLAGGQSWRPRRLRHSDGLIYPSYCKHKHMEMSGLCCCNARKQRSKMNSSGTGILICPGFVFLHPARASLAETRNESFCTSHRSNCSPYIVYVAVDSSKSESYKYVIYLVTALSKNKAEVFTRFCLHHSSNWSMHCKYRLRVTCPTFRVRSCKCFGKGLPCRPTLTFFLLVAFRMSSLCFGLKLSGNVLFGELPEDNWVSLDEVFGLREQLGVTSRLTFPSWVIWDIDMFLILSVMTMGRFMEKLLKGFSFPPAHLRSTSWGPYLSGYLSP